VLWTQDSILSSSLGVVRLRVSLPQSYESESGRDDRYPLLVVVGAEDNMAHAALISNLRLLSAPLSPALPPLIVIGVLSVGGETTLYPAGSTAATFRRRKSIADQFGTFFAAELLPWARQRFRTAPYTVIAGHSEPGHFAVSAYARFPEVFNGLVAISPAFWRIDDARNDDSLSRADALLIGRRARPGRAFVAVGQWDPVNIRRGVERFANQAKAAGVPLEYRILTNDNHQTARQTYVDGLRWLFAPISLSADRMYGMMQPFGRVEPRALLAAYDTTKAEYARGAAMFGLPPQLPESYLSSLFPFFVGAGDPRKELVDVGRALCEDEIRWYGERPFGHICLGDALVAASDVTRARKEYNSALDIARRQGLSGTVTFLERKLARLDSIPRNRK
jgi:enterochelin esterase-like enzyme